MPEESHSLHNPMPSKRVDVQIGNKTKKEEATHSANMLLYQWLHRMMLSIQVLKRLKPREVKLDNCMRTQA